MTFNRESRRRGMKPALCVVIGCLLGAVTLPANGLAGDPPPQSKRHHGSDAKEPHASFEVTFSTGDAALLKEHYAPTYRNLPPGLQKKLRRTGQLPPGWEKRFEPFPPALERELAPLPSGYRRGVLDGHAVIFNPRTHVLLDVVVLF